MVWITVIADHAEIFGILFWNQYIGVVILDFFSLPCDGIYTSSD